MMKNHTRHHAAKPFLFLALLLGATIPSLAGAALTSSVSPGGVLTVTATKRESVVITVSAGQVKINGQNPGSGPANASAITSISVAGSTNGASANTFDLSAVTPADFTALTAVTMDGGGGDDVLIGTSFNDQIIGNRGKDLIRGGPGDDTIDGGQQSDTVEVTNDADLAVNANTITGLGTDTLSNVENVRLRGGASANRITIAGWNGQGTFDGQGGNDTIIDSGDFNVTLTNASLARSTGRTFSLVSIESAELTGGGGANSYTLSGWAHPAILSGSGGTDTVISANNADFVLAPTLLQRTGGISIALSSIENANLTGTAAGNSFDVSAWNGGGSLTGTLPGGVLVCSRDANMTLTVGNFSTSAGTSLNHTNVTRAMLTGGASANIINATGYTGSATLNGLGGIDTLTGGSGKDTLISTSGLDVLNGAGNDDEYQVDFGAAASMLDSGVTTGDHATVSGSSADENLAITNTAITRGVETLALGGIDNVSVNQLAGDDAATPTSSSATGFALDGGTQTTQDVLQLDAANSAYILLPGSFQSGANKAITFSNYESVDIANSPSFPFVESTQPDGASPTSATSLRFRLRFSADVSGVDEADLSLALTGELALDAPLSVSGGPRDYFVDANLTGTNGTARLDVIDDDSIFAAGGVLLGGAGAGNGDFTSGLPYAVDNTPPTVATFTPAGASPTADSVVHFNLSFSEDVTGLTTDLLPVETETLTGSTISSIAGGPRDYTVTVDVGNGAGTLGLELHDDDTISDAAGNTLDGPGDGTISSNTVYTVDREAPTVQAITVATPNPTADNVAQFTISFSEPVTGLDASNFAFTTTGSVSTVLVSAVSNGTTVFTVDVDIPGSNLGTIRMDFVDNDGVTDLLGNPIGGAGTGNGDFTSGEDLTQDSVDPAAVITPLDASPTSLDQVRYSVAFDELVAPSFDLTDITVTGSLAATAAVTGTDPNYQVTLTLGNPSADGTVGFTLGTAIQDELGNTFAGADAPVYTIDNSLPSPTPTPSPTASPSPTPSVTASPSTTATPSPTATPGPSATPSASPSASPTPSATGTASPSPTASPTTSPSPTGTSTPTVSISPSPSPTSAPPRQSVVNRLLQITNDSTGLDANNDGSVDAADIAAP